MNYANQQSIQMSMKQPILFQFIDAVVDVFEDPCKVDFPAEEMERTKFKTYTDK